MHFGKTGLNLSLFSSAGKQLEQLTLETLKQQQDALHKLTSGVDELEKNYNNSLLSSITNIRLRETINWKLLNDQINEWQGQMEELSAHMHQLTVSPTKHHCQFLPKQAANLKKQQNNLLSNNNYNVKRLKTVRSFWESSRPNNRTRKNSRKTQKSIYFHQVRKMWQLTAKTNKTLSSSYYIKMAGIFDMEKKEDKMNPFQEAQTVPELRYDEIQVGDQASLTKQITDEDVINFAKLTGDVNPIHILDSFAKTTMFKERIAHGMLVSSFISTILGTKLPGKNTIYLSQNVSFRAPVKIGDTLRVVAEVIKNGMIKIITLQTNIYNQSGDIVVEGTATMKKEQICYSFSIQELLITPITSG